MWIGVFVLGFAVAFNVIWVAIHWKFFKPGGDLHREIYHSDFAKWLRDKIGTA